MKKSVMQKWVKALRSKKYKQGTQYLQSNDKYCCLGVLCCVAEEDGIPTARNVNIIRPDGKGLLQGTILNHQSSVVAWAGLKTPEGTCGTEYNADGEPLTLWWLNDQKHWSFKKIAAFIEKNWRKL